MYPEEGLLRLHNTYRHDLKTYSSDEGRCQKTAAAFLKGFLSLEGSLGPILGSLVNVRCKELLDDALEAKKDLNNMKQKLFKVLNTPGHLSETIEEQIVETQLITLIQEIGNPLQLMEEILLLLRDLVRDLKELQREQEEVTPTCAEEPLNIIYKRWKKLMKDFKHNNNFDISKISNIHNMLEYDIMHNRKIMPQYTNQLFHNIHKLDNFVTPLQYGMSVDQKLAISFKIILNLFKKIKQDLFWWINQDLNICSTCSSEQKFKKPQQFDTARQQREQNFEKHIRTRLYFTSASHMYSLFNVIKYGIFFKFLAQNQKQFEEKFTLDYLSYFVLRIYENLNVPTEDKYRFRIEISLSYGAQIEQLQEDTHASPVEPFITLNSFATFQQVISCFDSINSINGEEAFSPIVMPIFQ